MASVGRVRSAVPSRFAARVCAASLEAKLLQPFNCTQRRRRRPTHYDSSRWRLNYYTADAELPLCWPISDDLISRWERGRERFGARVCRMRLVSVSIAAPKLRLLLLFDADGDFV